MQIKIKHKNKYIMQIRIKEKRKAKLCSNEIEAARLYDYYAKIFHGEFATLNFKEK